MFTPPLRALVRINSKFEWNIQTHTFLRALARINSKLGLLEFRLQSNKQEICHSFIGSLYMLGLPSPGIWHLSKNDGFPIRYAAINFIRLVADT